MLTCAYCTVLSKHVPLLIPLSKPKKPKTKRPWLPQSHGQRSAAPTELIDVFPTLAELAGLGQPVNDAFALEGVSLTPVLKDPTLPTLPSRDYALSTYPRCPPEVGGHTWTDSCIHQTERTSFKYMGYTIRTTEYDDSSTSFLVNSGTPGVGSKLLPHLC